MCSRGEPVQHDSSSSSKEAVQLQYKVIGVSVGLAHIKQVLLIVLQWQQRGSCSAIAAAQQTDCRCRIALPAPPTGRQSLALEPKPTVELITIQ
jgi:hypothetical protein